MINMGQGSKICGRQPLKIFSRYITSNFLKADFHKFYLVHFEYLDSCVLLEAIVEHISWKCFVNAEHKSLISLLESCYELSFGRYCYNHGDRKWSWAARLINLAIHAPQQAFTWSKSSIEKRQEICSNLTKTPVIDIVRVALLSLNIFHIFLLLMLTMYLFAGFICFKLGRILIWPSLAHYMKIVKSRDFGWRLLNVAFYEHFTEIFPEC